MKKPPKKDIKGYTTLFIVPPVTNTPQEPAEAAETDYSELIDYSTPRGFGSYESTEAVIERQFKAAQKKLEALKNDLPGSFSQACEFVAETYKYFQEVKVISATLVFGSLPGATINFELVYRNKNIKVIIGPDSSRSYRYQDTKRVASTVHYNIDSIRDSVEWLLQ